MTALESHGYLIKEEWNVGVDDKGIQPSWPYRYWLSISRTNSNKTGFDVS